MKFVHLSDLHIGKVVNGFSMLEDQKYILNEILGIIDVQKPDAILIAGDIFDRGIPPESAINVADDFFGELLERKLPILAISGNHDSAVRISFNSGFMRKSGFYMTSNLAGDIGPITLTDEYGPVNFWLLPYIQPFMVRKAFPDDEFDGYSGAVETVVRHMNIDKKQRNVILSHQYVEFSETSGSEESAVGTINCIGQKIYDDFDYVALGHIHQPATLAPNHMRYCGTQLSYNFSSHDLKEKTLTVVEMGPKGSVEIKEIPLHPLHAMRTVFGTFDEIMNLAASEDYLKVTLHDEQEIPNVMNELRSRFPNVMHLEYDNTRSRRTAVVEARKKALELHPAKLFAEFYENMSNHPMTEEQEKIVDALVREIWEGEKE